MTGLTLKLDAFCEDCQRQGIDLYSDEIDEQLAKEYQAEMDVTQQVESSVSSVKGWNPNTESRVLGEIHMSAHASFRLNTGFVRQLYGVGKNDPLVLAVDVVANALHHHLRNLPSDASLNQPTSVSGWVLEDCVYGVRENAIEDLL